MMMRKHSYVILIASTIVLQQCATSKEAPYTFPEANHTDVRGDFTVQFERGEVLYRSSCGGCHNKHVEGRTVIPDFSLAQLLDYEMRMQYPSHGQRLHESKVSKEELDDIQVFLRYRKPSGYPVAPPPVPQAPPKVN